MARYNPELPVDVGPFFRVKIFGTLLGQSTQTTLIYGRQGEAAETPSLEDFAENFEDLWFPWWVALVYEGWAGTLLRVDRFDQPLIAPYEKGITTTVGTMAGDPCPSFVSMRLRRITGIAGQHGRGTLRIPGVVEESTLGNKLVATQGPALVSLAEACLDSLETANPAEGSWIQYMATRTEDPGPPVTFTVRAAPVMVAVAIDNLGTSRSRMPRTTI